MTRALSTLFRLLTFRATADELRSFDRSHLALGLVLTWLVGIGRWWEDPRAGFAQHLGLGSVIYVFALALFLWLLLWPMAPQNWTYFNVLTFVSRTSLPGILYAIPVRHGINLYSAQTVRMWLLAVVAGWRVLLLGFFLARGAGFTGGQRFVGTLFPLVMIVVILTSLNLEKVVFSFMGAIEKEQRSVNDAAYGVLFLLTMLSELMALPLFVGYIVLSFQAFAKRRAQRRQ